MKAWVIKKDRKYWDEIAGAWVSLCEATTYRTKGTVEDFLADYIVYSMCNDPLRGHPVKVNIEEA